MPEAQVWHYTPAESPINAYGQLNARNSNFTTFNGVSYGGRAHPLPGSTNAKYISFDGNHATSHQLEVGNFARQNGGGAWPSSTKRQSAVLQYFFAIGATNPTSTARIWDGVAGVRSSFGAKFYLTSDRKIILETYRSGSLSETFNAADAIPAGAADYVIQVVYIMNELNPIIHEGTRQILVRLINPTTRAVVGTYINAISTGAMLTAQNSGSFILGETTARGAGFEFHISGICFGFQDPDDLYGIIRPDFLFPDGIGHLTEWTSTAAADVDDTSAAGVPDGDTTHDHVTFTTGGGSGVTKDQLYSLSAPLDAVSADLIIGLTQHVWAVSPFPLDKASVEFYNIFSDGTNDDFSSSTNTAVDLYQNFCTYYELDPAGAALTHGDLAGLQIGARARHSSTLTYTFKMSALSLCIAYQKGGETIVAIDPPPVSGGQPVFFGGGVSVI